MKTIELKRARAALIAENRAMIDTAETANRDLTQGENSEQTIYDAKLAEARSLQLRIDREEAQFAIEAANAQPLTGQARNIEVGAVAKPRVDGQGFLDCVRSIGLFGRDRRGAADYAENTLHSPDVARALNASIGSSGGFAVPTILAEEFIEFLRPASVVRAAGPTILPMPKGNLSLPAVTGGASATWVGENSVIPATQQTIGLVKLIAKKLAALVPISNDLIRYANPQTDAVIRKDLVKSVSQAEDLAFIRGDGTSYTPKGMKNWAANTFTGTATLDIAHLTTDLGTMISYLLTANVPVTLETGHFFFSPRSYVFLKTLRNPTTGQYAFPEMQGADPRLLGYKVSYTSQIPTNLGTGAQSEAYFVSMDECVIGETANLMLDVSSEASYVDSGNNVVSSFAQDQTIIRVIEENDFAMRYSAAAVYESAVNF
jgi:HK97 family phage major capsid protein